MQARRQVRVSSSWCGWPSRTILPRQRLLFDIKTIHGGSDHYYSAHAREEQSGAVRHREAAVWPDYLRHARALDQRFHAGVTPGPVETLLRGFGGATRGLVFGAYGEASGDVHALLSVAATALAVWQWQPSGARTLEECRAYIIQASRRRVGLVAVQAMARHRLARAPYIGVTRAVVEARHRRGSVGPSPPLSDAWGRFDGIYQWQADHRTAVVA